MTEATLFENGGDSGNTNAAGADAAPTRVLRELNDGEEFCSVLVVRERQLRQKKNGEDFLKLQLGDRTGAVPAIAWDRISELFEACSPGAIVMVTGKFSVHPQFGRQIKLAAARAAEPHEYDSEDLSEGPAKASELLESELRELLETIQNPSLRALLDRFFGPETASWSRFREAPAAKHYHQAYAGGLLEHTLSVAQAVSAAANFFPGIDRDVAVTGALLHDIGKTEAYTDDPLAIDMTDAGRLQAEIPLGYYKVRRQIEEIEGFDTGLAQAVLHIILSHHGQLEHGSPVVPCTREATLVHSMDNLGGKLGSFDRLEKELGDGESWSRFDRGIESAAFFGARAA
jgi:3'-5' exoribonuclease